VCGQANARLAIFSSNLKLRPAELDDENRGFHHHMPARCGAGHRTNPRSALIRRCDHGGGFFIPRRFAMMRWIISCFVAVGLFAAPTATTVLRSHSISGNQAAKTAMMPSVQELQHATDSSKLPVEVMDDHQVVYPQQPSR